MIEIPNRYEIGHYFLELLLIKIKKHLGGFHLPLTSFIELECNFRELESQNG